LSGTNKHFILSVVVALDPSKKTLEKLILDLGMIHQVNLFFGHLQPMRSFTTLRTMHLSQGVIGYFESAYDSYRKPLTVLLPRSIEDLVITDFDRFYGKAVLGLAKEAATGKYPNLKRVRLIRERACRGFMSGKSFIAFATGQDASPEVNDGHGGYIDMDPHEPRCDDEEEEKEEKEDDDDGGDVEDGDGEEDESESEDISPAWWAWWAGVGLAHTQEWMEFGRRCLSDRDLMFEIACHVEEDSTIYLRPTIDPGRLRKKARMLFSKANVKFECVGVEVTAGPRGYGEVHIVYM
jgi:hypothetical protein